MGALKAANNTVICRKANQTFMFVSITFESDLKLLKKISGVRGTYLFHMAHNC